MSINLRVPASLELHPKITVFGVGGAGGNAVTNMIKSELEGVDFVVANTDAQALQGSKAERKIQMGAHITQGLGAGARPEVGRAAAEESLDEIVENLAGAHMVFITAGMGGGTGTGAAPVIAAATREQGILTVGVVTKPFHFEGMHRMRIADAGIQELQQFVDTLIIIPNQNLFRVANEKTTFADAFKMADDVLYSGVRGVTDLMVMPGLINLDFADIRAVMSEMGKAMMGTGEAEGDRRSIDAAEAAISNPLLDDVSMKGARGVLINITGGPDMTLFEVDEAANRIREEVDPEANIIFGSTFDDSLEGRIRISVVATGIDAAAMAQPRPVISLVSDRSRSEPVTVQPAAVAAAVAASQPLAPAMPMAVAGAPATAGTSALAMAQPQPAVVVAPVQPVVQAPPQPVIEPQLAVRPTAETEALERAPVRESFIPPKPVEPQTRPVVVTAPVVTPADPFAAAAMTNGAKPQPSRKVRGPSLFERVTGAARHREPQPEPVPPAATAPAASAPTPPQPAAVRSEPQQPRLGPLDPADRVTVSKAEEDLLEIPAFLRRQAN